MISPMPIENLPSWKAINNDYPVTENSQDLNYVIIGATLIVASVVAYIIINNQKENNKENNT